MKKFLSIMITAAMLVSFAGALPRSAKALGMVTLMTITSPTADATITTPTFPVSGIFDQTVGATPLSFNLLVTVGTNTHTYNFAATGTNWGPVTVDMAHFPSMVIGGTYTATLQVNYTAAFPIILGDTKTITWNPVPGGPYTLTVNVNPLGSGTVTLNPAGGTYAAGTSVTLTANPAAGYYFASWSGDPVTVVSPNTATITMNANKTVTANFSTTPLPTTGVVVITKGPTLMDNLCGITDPVVQYTMGDRIDGAVQNYSEALKTALGRTHAVLVNNIGTPVLTAPVDTAGGFSIETTTVYRDGDYYLVWDGYDGVYGTADDVRFSYLSGGATRYDIYIKYVFIETSPSSIQYDCLSHIFAGWVKTGGASTTTTVRVQVHVIMPNTLEAPGSPVSVGLDGYWALSVQINQKGTYKVWVDESPTPGDPTNPSYGTCKQLVYFKVTTGVMSAKITPIISPTILYATGLSQDFGVYVTDQDGDPVTGITAADWTVTGLAMGASVTEAFDGVYIFSGVPAGAGSVTVALINYMYLGTKISASALVTVKAPSAFNPYVSIWGNSTNTYTISNDNGVCDTIHENIPCTPGKWIGITLGVADLVAGTGDTDYNHMVSDPANYEMWESRAWVSGPVERLSANSAIASNNRWIGGKMVEGDGYGQQVEPINYRYLVNGQGTVKITIKAKIWQKAVAGGWTDSSSADFRGMSPDYEKFNACCIEKEQTFTICTINACKVDITTPTAEKTPTVSLKAADGEKSLGTQVNLTVGDKTDLNFAIANDPNLPSVSCGCNLIIHLKACGPTANRDMFTLSDGRKVDEIWYNPAGKIPEDYTTAPVTTNPFDWVSTGGVITLKGVTVNHAASWYEAYGIGMTNVSQGILVEVFGEKMKTCPITTVYPRMFYDPIAIQVNPKVTTMSTKILGSLVTDPKTMVAGVSETLNMSGFDPLSGIFTGYYDEYYDDGNWTNVYYDVANLGGGAYQATISPAFDRAGTFYFDIYAKDGDTMGEATIEVVKPKFDIKLQLSNGNTIDNDGSITEGTVEGILFTAVDPRDETIELSPTNAWAEPTGVGEAFYGYTFYYDSHKSYPADDWPVASCGLPTTYVYNANVCGGCSPLRVIALDNPNISDSPQIVVLWQRDGADVVMSLFDVKVPSISVDPNKDIPFYGCPTCGNGTDLVFSAIDAHNQGLVNGMVNLSVDVAPSMNNVNWTYDVYTGPDGKVTFHFNPPYAGNFKASLYADASKYDWPNLSGYEPDDWMIRPKVGFLNRIMTTFTSIYKAPVVDTEKPVITIDAPADGAEVNTSVVTVTGKVTDNVGVVSLYIGAMKVDFAPDGTFSTKVELAEGANTIKVFAFDAAANNGEKDITVKYTKPVELKKTVVVVQIGSDIMTVNGKAVQIDAPAEIMNGRTFLPLRAISEALGATVEWIAETQGITVTLGDNTIGLQVGNTSAVVNGTVMTLDAAPYIKNGRTMVPFRVIAEGLGAVVTWDPDLKTVTITLVQAP